MIIGFVTVLAVLLIGSSLASEAQTGKVYRIGILERTSMIVNAANVDAFRQGLRDLGYVEAKNVVIEYRSVEGRNERYADLAAELVRLKVDVILTRGTPATLAAMTATATISIVMTGIGDPVGSGIVGSLSRPGGNVTGVTSLAREVHAKRVELLKELVPGAARIAALFNMSSPHGPPEWKVVEMAARSLGIQAQLLDVRRREDLAPTFATAIRQRANALVVPLDAVT